MKPMQCTILILLVWLSGCQSQQISSVKIWNKDFQIVRTIEDPAELDAFVSLWNDRTKMPARELNRSLFTHKVDIMTYERSTRWLYAPEGQATILNMKKTPVYRITDPEALNKILISQPAER